MKAITLQGIALLIFVSSNVFAQTAYDKHPNTTEQGWTNLFKKDLPNANYPNGIWSDSNGIITATKDDVKFGK
jgi:hypothetical protein